MTVIQYEELRMDYKQINNFCFYTQLFFNSLRRITWNSAGLFKGYLLNFPSFTFSGITKVR